MAIVYIARNRVNGHRYIGVTTKTLARRRATAKWAADHGEGGLFSEAIRQFRVEAFEWFPLAEIADHEQALKLERELTRVLRPEYNLVFGGGGRPPYIHRPVNPRSKATTAGGERVVLPLPKIEEWRPVNGYEGWYEVSSHARVRSLQESRRWRYGAILKPQIDRDTGRHNVSFSVRGRVRKVRLATVVAQAFLGPRPVGKEVCHVSDDKSDNKINNLYYGTHQQNCHDRSRNGKTMRGAKATGVKLLEDQVREIKAFMLVPGLVSQRELAIRYKVDRGTIANISQGKTWSHIEANNGIPTQ